MNKNMQKRFKGMIAGTLTAVMLAHAFMPAVAFAAHHHASPPPHHGHHGYHHHDYYHDKWTKNDTLQWQDWQR